MSIEPARLLLGSICLDKLYKSTATFIVTPAPVGSNPTAALVLLFIEGLYNRKRWEACISRPSQRAHDTKNSHTDATREDKKQPKQDKRQEARRKDYVK